MEAMIIFGVLFVMMLGTVSSGFYWVKRRLKECNKTLESVLRELQKK